MGNQTIKLDSVKIWRLNLKPSSQQGVDVFDFCKERKVVGFGWVLSQKPNTIEQCIQLGQKEYTNGRGFIRSITAMQNMKENDLIWTRKGGVYYLSRIKTSWRYDDSDEFRNADIVNMVEVHDFVKVGALDEVPGKIQRSFIPSSTLQRVTNIENITATIYNRKIGANYYSTNIPARQHLLEILSPEDIEEIVCLYLQAEKHYIMYSSTCKKGTELYECVMVKNDGSHKCYPQVKTGDVGLNGAEYVHLTENGKDFVYLFAANQRYTKVQENENIIYLDTNTILNFMESHENILPERIREWLQFTKG